MRRKITVTVIILIILAGLIWGGFYLWRGNKTNVIAREEKPSNKIKDYFEINDETVGVYFKIKNQFERMSITILQTINRDLLYGFSSKKDNKIACFLSQTKREKGGGVKLADAEKGILDEIRKKYPDIRVDFSSVVSVGENNKGAKFYMTYTDNDGKKWSQWEVFATTDKTATFAFCMAPEEIIDPYKDDFEIFLNSLRVK